MDRETWDQLERYYADRRAGRTPDHVDEFAVDMAIGALLGDPEAKHIIGDLKRPDGGRPPKRHDAYEWLSDRLMALRVWYHRAGGATYEAAIAQVVAEVRAARGACSRNTVTSAYRAHTGPAEEGSIDLKRHPELRAAAQAEIADQGRTLSKTYESTSGRKAPIRWG